MSISRAEAARRLGCKPEKVLKMVQDGRMVGQMIEGKYRFEEAEVERVKRGDETPVSGGTLDEIKKLNDEAELLTAKTRLIKAKADHEQATLQLNEIEQAKVNKAMADIEGQKAEIERAFALTKKRAKDVAKAQNKFEEYKRAEEEKLEAGMAELATIQSREEAVVQREADLNTREQSLDRREARLERDREALRGEKKVVPRNDKAEGMKKRSILSRIF